MLLSKKSVLLSAVAGAVLLTAGGVQAQSSAPEPAPYHMADGTRTADYNEAVASWRADSQFGVDYSKAYLGLEHAYALGLSGKGVTAGINDSGVYWDHPLFKGRNNGLDTGASDALGNNGSISTTEPWHSHGTHVAGTAVGRRVEGGAHGAFRPGRVLPVRVAVQRQEIAQAGRVGLSFQPPQGPAGLGHRLQVGARTRGHGIQADFLAR